MVAAVRLRHCVGADQLRVHLAQRAARATARDDRVIDAVSLLERAQPVSAAAKVKFTGLAQNSQVDPAV